MDVSEDPTLTRSAEECPKCHEQEAVFYQNDAKVALGMILTYVCRRCKASWSSEDMEPEEGDAVEA